MIFQISKRIYSQKLKKSFFFVSSKVEIMFNVILLLLVASNLGFSALNLALGKNVDDTPSNPDPNSSLPSLQHTLYDSLVPAKINPTISNENLRRREKKADENKVRKRESCPTNDHPSSTSDTEKNPCSEFSYRPFYVTCQNRRSNYAAMLRNCVASKYHSCTSWW